MKSRIFLGLVVAAFATPGVAAPGTDRATRGVFEGYTACIVKQFPTEAAKVVLSTIPSNQIVKDYPELVAPACLDIEELSIPDGDFLRYGFAEELVRREYSHGLPADFAQAGPIRHMQVNESDYQPKPGKTATAKELAALDGYKKRDLAVQALSIYGECVVRADPADALALVLSEQSSADEASAFGKLQPALSSCLTRGATITLDKAAIRGSVAMNLYRLAKAPRVAATAASSR